MIRITSMVLIVRADGIQGGMNKNLMNGNMVVQQVYLLCVITFSRSVSREHLQ